jgi:hypothetical protein
MAMAGRSDCEYYLVHTIAMRRVWLMVNDGCGCLIGMEKLTLRLAGKKRHGMQRVLAAAYIEASYSSAVSKQQRAVSDRAKDKSPQEEHC